ncbi:MAG: hypothetical protein QM831_02690 [Kofleriaceae bacterium]
MQRLAVLAVVLCGCSSKKAEPPAAKTDPAAIVAIADRTEHDKKLDPGRKPTEMLAFMALKPGMRVADLAAGSGYTTELVARSIGPTGKMFAQDSPSWDGDELKKIWVDRLARTGLANTTHVMRAWEDPIPPEAKDLDEITFVCAYHDVYAEKGDVKKMDAAMLAALRPHGTLVIIDNSAKDGSGTADVERLHRIDEKVVRADLEAAGFKFVSDASFLRNPGDPRDWNADPGADPKTHTQDRFVLKFEKP